MMYKVKSLFVIILLVGVAACASYDYNKQIAEVEKNVL